jgi:hypothetical protein
MQSEADGLRRFSNSELQTFKDCKRKWWLSYYRRLGLIAKEVIGPRPIGTGVHHALAVHYSGSGDPILELRKLHAEWEEHLSADGKDLKKFRSQSELQRIMVEGYFQWLEETGADADLEVVDTETYLEAPLEIPDYGTVLIIGKIDLRVRKRSDGSYWVLDHKSVPNFVTKLFMLRSDEQMLHYHLLEELQGTGVKTGGAIYNMLRKVKRSATAKSPFYDRVDIRHNPIQMSTYAARLKSTIHDILSVTARLDQGESHQTAVYPRPNADCNWKCDFSDTCPMFDDGSRAEDMLSMLYVEHDPLERYHEADTAEGQ